MIVAYATGWCITCTKLKSDGQEVFHLLVHAALVGNLVDTC